MGWLTGTYCKVRRTGWRGSATALYTVPVVADSSRPACGTRHCPPQTAVASTSPTKQTTGTAYPSPGCLILMCRVDHCHDTTLQRPSPRVSCFFSRVDRSSLSRMDNHATSLSCWLPNRCLVYLLLYSSFSRVFCLGVVEVSRSLYE